MINEVSIAVLLAVLLGVLVRTAAPFFIKKRNEGVSFDVKFVLTAIASLLPGVIPIALEIFFGIEIMPDWNPYWAFAGFFLITSGLNDLLNRWGITVPLALKKFEKIVGE